MPFVSMAQALKKFELPLHTRSWPPLAEESISCSGANLASEVNKLGMRIDLDFMVTPRLERRYKDTV